MSKKIQLIFFILFGTFFHFNAHAAKNTNVNQNIINNLDRYQSKSWKVLKIKNINNRDRIDLKKDERVKIKKNAMGQYFIKKLGLTIDPKKCIEHSGLSLAYSDSYYAMRFYNETDTEDQYDLFYFYESENSEITIRKIEFGNGWLGQTRWSIILAPYN